VFLGHDWGREEAISNFRETCAVALFFFLWRAAWFSLVRFPSIEVGINGQEIRAILATDDCRWPRHQGELQNLKAKQKNGK
jgi:hypothetical protein